MPGFDEAFLPDFGEYVRELIRRDQERLQLRSLLLAGASFAPAAPADERYREGGCDASGAPVRSRCSETRSGAPRNQAWESILPLIDFHPV